jgi:tetratricopeptide (TPR) repeat protein
MSNPHCAMEILRHSAAISILIACVSGMAVSPADLRQTAVELAQEGRVAEAEEAWRSVLEKNPSDAEAYANLALLEGRQEHYKDAVVSYRKALLLKPAMPGVRLDLGLSLFKGGDFRAALQAFDSLLKSEPKSSPDSLRVKTLIGLAHYGLGEYPAAVPYLKEATAADPQNLPSRLALAQSCLWSNQYQCVLNVYHEILLLNADSAEADMLAGEALDEMKDKPGAVEQFRAAVKSDPKIPGVHFGLGYLLWGLMQFDEAAREFQAELDNNPNHVEALAFLADTEIKLSHPELAHPLLEKAIQLDPGIEIAHLDLSVLFSDADKREDEIRELKIAERINPNDQEVHWRLGRFFKSIGKSQEATAEFAKTKQLQKAADQTVFEQLHKAQEKGKSGQANHVASLERWLTAAWI